jgi:two-component system, OmpR family, phosphate regulon sensor histidine kinase PhoR
MTDLAQTRLLDLFDLPALLIEDDQVRFANPAARTLLGAHIVGENVRIALRAPDAVALIARADGGRARIAGLSVSGSIWDMTCHVLESGERLVTLQDMSVQVSVARSHADFVANASHELRTPLAAILGYVETLGDAKAGDDAKTRARFLGIIKREAERMQTLVEDLMSLSRIEAVKHEVPTELVDLVALSREVAGEFGERAEVVVTSANDQAEVGGDRGQLAQAIRNLIDNGIKYGGPDGKLRVTLEAAATGWLLLQVQDDGPGIAPEHLPRLTERFYRADASRSRAMGGTGLGLAIVKHIAERHRGRFDISSRAGSGTTASLMLPLRKAS